MKMHVAGQWIDKSQKIEVVNPYDSSVIDTVPKADRADIDRALASAERGAKVMAHLSGYERWKILKTAAEIMAQRNEELGQLISKEEGKIIAEGRLEANRAVETVMGSAEEAKRIHGETIPLDGAPGSAGKLGFTLRVPCGVVVAISPFNFPLNLVCHKVGPALAAGNAVVVKPATDTPLSALRLTEILLEAGVPPEGIQCVTGAGSEIGDLLCADRRVRKITFTGSRDVGERICRVAGIKKVTMELGSNSPVIVMPDANLDKVAAAVAATGYANAGQVCISTQRVLTMVADVKPEMRISCDELFGPAVAVTPVAGIDEAIQLANDTIYGLAAGIFTENLEWAMRFAREVQSGNLHVNYGPQWRADLMPYGGLKESGFGKEGPRYAVEEMTDLKMVVFHLST